jgi:4-diphosphocytidyl-2-C-methyl-D-erythritol kinase
MLTRNAYAKINLSLEVTSKRADGYHEIASVMQLVDLHDTLTFSAADEIQVECSDPLLGAVGENNLVWRAAKALREAAGVDKGTQIEVAKRIPVSAGLAGGSSDAAATLLGLAELWDLGMGEGELRQIASMLGSDVPFFLDGPTALVEGRGERVTPLSALQAAWLVLVSPPYRIAGKTRRMYESLSKQDLTNGAITRLLAATIHRGEFPSPSLLYNAFERSAYRLFEGLDGLRQTMVETGADHVHLSGSGPSLFLLYPQDEEQQAQAIHETLQAEGLRTFLTRTIGE